jgi:hypothetical protein
MTGKTRVLPIVSTEDTEKFYSIMSAVKQIPWRPPDLPPGLLVAFSSRGVAPEGTASPTEYLSRRFAEALSLPDVPIIRATQVHGRNAVEIAEAPPAGTVRDAGQCDIPATALPGVALVVQTADCVPIVLAGSKAIAVVHSGWRGTAKNAAESGVAALERLGRSLAAPRLLGPFDRRLLPRGRRRCRPVRRRTPGASCAPVPLDIAGSTARSLEAAGSGVRHLPTTPARCAAATASPVTAATRRRRRMIALAVRSKV